MKIGFDVKPWKNKPFHEFTNEELVEYYYKLRFVAMMEGKGNKELGPDSEMADMYVVELQEEILRRMSTHERC